ncbi:MAG: CBS domain-containing protein [Bdellovibrionaceae bacterium]|nr:CBS domain-containing protein [Pseudobdellovibrionaceae bacterium]
MTGQGKNNNLSIAPYMTKLPHTIGSDQPLVKAERLMSYLKVRHLPVLEGGKLVGILSDRDIKLLESFKDINPEETSVSEALSEDVYMVSSETPVSEVCKKMAEKKYGSVLVVDNKKLVGIFTWIDALNAMIELLEKKEPTH